MEKFNYHMLNLARDARGLTQAELASRAGIVQGTMSKYETGQAEPPPAAVGQLAAALSYPEPFFFEPGRPYGFPPYHFRKRKKLGTKPLNKISAEMNIRRLHIQKMIVSYDVKARSPLPELDPDEYRGPNAKKFDVEDIARSIRESWLLPRGPIPNVTELIENAGGIVIPCDFGTDLLDGMSQRIDGLPVLFFMNTKVPGDRLRYSLAHELGHMILHTLSVKPDDEMEDEADQFAGALLLPPHELRAQLREFNLRHLANMKGYWRVSMAAIAMRAGRLKYISPYQSKMFWMDMSREGYRKREPVEIPPEQPRILHDMIQFHRGTLGYSVDQMASLLNLTQADYLSMYEVIKVDTGSRGSHLRLVKT
jgi:Zn-dependent peptidase ImmA (M78 family)/transcriptional regulator with XRE-family HTH domain